MTAVALAVLILLAAPAPATRHRQTRLPPQPVFPVLAFPEQGLDDSIAYLGYETRFFRDAAGNTVQIYLDRRDGRVVHLLANAEDESVGFTARDAAGRPATLRWDGPGAVVARNGRTRSLEHRLVAEGDRVQIGLPLLGSMRVERDLQYSGRQRAPFGGPTFPLAEMTRLLSALDRVEPTQRGRDLASLGAATIEDLRRRLEPSVVVRQGNGRWSARFTQRSLDGRDTIAMEIETKSRDVQASRADGVLTLRARSGNRVPFTVRIATTARPLTPLAREEIFTPEFLAFLADTRTRGERDGAVAATRSRRMERQVRGVELLASREKLMAGLPTYATYFGRDMLVSALMMRPIWQSAMSEAVIAAVLRKLGPGGDVSHEEALGGQAAREAANEYSTLVDQWALAKARGDRSAADSLLARARTVIADVRRVRENYHMIDDEFQLPVLVGRWITDPTVTSERKRAFLLDASDGGQPRVVALLRELALVSRMTAAYAREPIASNLVSFARRDSTGWASASWRDSGDGYANGRYAMDVNAIWAPHALQAIARILDALRTIGLPADSIGVANGNVLAGSPLENYARDTLSLRRAISAWSNVERHFLVRLAPAAVRAAADARIGALPAGERAFWASRLAPAVNDSLTFLALSLDASGQPIAVANSDPATRLFLGEVEGPPRSPNGAENERVLRDVRLFTRDYPVGLFIEQVGPVVANDAPAPPSVWQAFERDPYHGPRVVWGREVNLFLLGVAGRAVAASDPSLAASVQELRAAADKVRRAVDASGFHSELWSYGFESGRPAAVRYGSGADVQLWSTTDLAVQFVLSRLEW